MPSVLSLFGVDPFRIGGTETFARELSSQLAEYGWESVLCFQKDPTPSVREFLSLPNASLTSLKDLNQQNSRTIISAARLLKRYQPDIVHLHFTGFLSALPWLARVFGVKKVFFTDHTSRPAGYVPHSAPIWKKAAVRMINWPVTQVVSVSNFGYRCMVDLNLLPIDRFQMIYNGVDLSRVHTNHERGKAFRKKFGIPDDKYVIVQVSWIIPEKGISELLQTAKLVIDRNQDVFFVIVGEGVYRTQYMREAESLGIERNIRWTGLVKDPFDEGVFEAADVVCQLSNWEEVFGWMIAEGMAHAKPIVATSVGGIPELIKNGESGFLVARGDVTPTATALLTLLSDPALRRRFGDCGRWIVQEKFNLKTNVAQLMKTYGIPNDSAIGDNG